MPMGSFSCPLGFRLKSSGSTLRSVEHYGIGCSLHKKFHVAEKHFPISPSFCVVLDTSELALLNKCVHHISDWRAIKERTQSFSSN